MAGTPEKMVEYLLETRVDNTNNFDGKDAIHVLRPCYTTKFFLQLATQQTLHSVASCENNCPCNTPFSQLAMQQNVALQVARKVELSSSFRNVARQVAACNMSCATCNVHQSSSLRCKLKENCLM